MKVEYLTLDNLLILMQNNCLDLKAKGKKKIRVCAGNLQYSSKKRNTKLYYYIKVIYNSLQIKEKKTCMALRQYTKAPVPSKGWAGLIEESKNII